MVSPSKDVSAGVEPSILDPSNPRRVLEVAKGEPRFEAKFVVNVLVDEKVPERFVKGHEDDPVVASDKRLDSLDAESVYVETSNSQPHRFVEVPQKRLRAYIGNIRMHLLKLCLRCREVES